MVHQYKLGEYNIVIDVCSGSIHAVDDIAYDIIELFEEEDRNTVIEKITQKYSVGSDVTAEDISECYDQVAELAAKGRLFTQDIFANGG